MTPVIQRLRKRFPELPWPLAESSKEWTFDQSIKNMGVDFYRQLTLLHPELMVEYAALCNQITDHLSSTQTISKGQIIEELEAALMLAELLGYTHLHYLNVPREVLRLGRHLVLYRDLLVQLDGHSFSSAHILQPELPDPRSQYSFRIPGMSLSLSQQIRETTAFTNPFRLLFTRGKRFLNFLTLVLSEPSLFKEVMTAVDSVVNPVLAYVGWCFFVPRLSTNLFLLGKHAIPGFWMGEQEKSLGWWVRFKAQLPRRWFELANDILWLTLGLCGCFVLLGPLVPAGVYYSVTAFAIDIVFVSIRAYVELKRLYNLQAEYTELRLKAPNSEEASAIEEYQSYLAQRIRFEQMRLSLSVGVTTAIFVAMVLAIPVLAVNPWFPLIGAGLLLVTWVINYVLTQKLEHYRPRDAVPQTSNLTKFGIFAAKPELQDLQLEPSDELIPDSP